MSVSYFSLEMISLLLIASLLARVLCQNKTDTPSTDNDIKTACIQGNKVGAFLITSPNSSAYTFADTKMVIKWKYTNWVTKPPSFVSVKLQKQDVPTTWATVVVQNATLNGASSLEWTPTLLSDGLYKVNLGRNDNDRCD